MPGPDQNAMMEQQMAQVFQQLYEKAISLQRISEHEKAARLLIEAATIADQIAPDISNQVRANAMEEFVKCGAYSDARELLMNLPLSEESPQKLFTREDQLATYCIYDEDPTALSHIERAEALAKSTSQPEKNHALVMKRRGEFFAMQHQFAEAETCFRQAIDIHLKLHETAEAKTLSKDALSAFFELQKLYIVQGKPQISEKILTEEVEPHTIHDYEDLTFYWHLTHVAYIYVENDYTQYAESAWKRIFDTYQSKYDELTAETATGKRSSFEERVISIVANSRNEHALMQYNQGKIQAAKETFAMLSQRGYNLQTTSKYFDTVNSNCLIGSDERDNAKCTFLLELKIRNKRIMPPNCTIRFRVECLDGELVDETEHTYEDNTVIIMRSSDMSSVRKGPYILFAELAEELREDTYSHRQAISVQYDFQPGTNINELVRSIRRS